MFDFDAFEEDAGHELTMIHGPSAGISTYYCENCGALVQLDGHDLVLFHVPRGSESTETRCATREGSAQPSLKDKLRDLFDKDYEKLRAM